jgi:hypothetical protein
MAEPIKNRTAVEVLRAFKVMGKQIIGRELKPRIMRVDNESSQLLKDYLFEKNISFQLVSPYSHCCNAAELAIRSFKDHLSGVYVQQKNNSQCICEIDYYHRI